jgi:hypothetical protein
MMHTRRFTRLTNAFSKKVENHAHSVALFAMYYNFVRIHKTLRTTPAMAAKVTKRLWEIGDIVDVLVEPMTLEPRRPGAGFGLKANWPGLVLIILGGILLLAWAGLWPQ